MPARAWDPFTALARLDTEFDQLMRRTWGPAARTTSGYVPAVDITTDGPDVVITLELPGVDVENDVDIQVHQGRLTISGERRESRRVRQGEGESDSGKVLVSELHYGSFRREFALPEGVGADQVDASYDRGLLEVRVRGVTKPPEQPKKVQIRSGSAARTIEASAESSS